jgi:hypothetical protein
LIHSNLLQYRGARYLWWALALVVIGTALFMSQGDKPHSGDTWQGYVLGSGAAALILWLMMLGVRKRSYSSGAGTVQGWVSAHVYLGIALLVIATLHCAVQFGWNVHTLAYVLMCAVIGSGIFGVYSYLAHPRAIADNRSGSARSALFAELFEMDKHARALADRCDASIRVAVASSIERTAVGGGALAQLLGRDGSHYMGGADATGVAKLVPNPDQQPVIDFVAARLPRAEKGSEAAVLQELVVALCRRQLVLRRIRRDIRLSAVVRVWLYVHVPLSVALVGAVVVHVLVTFIYW